jgi:hypothetical protein
MVTISYYNYTSDNMHYLKKSGISAEHLRLIRSVINIPNLVIEVIDKWLWISGETYINRCRFASTGFVYYRQTKRWLFGPDQRLQSLKPGCNTVYIIHTVCTKVISLPDISDLINISD